MGPRDRETPDGFGIKRLFLIILKILVSAGLLTAVLSRTGIDHVLSILAGVHPAYFLGASLMYVASVCLSSMRWRLLLPEGFELKRLFSLYLIGSFFNTILPGIIGGDAVKAYYLYKETGNGTSAIASVFMDRYIGFAALMFIGLTAYPLGFRYYRGSYIEWLLPLIVMLFVTGSIAVLGLRIGRRIRALSEVYDYVSLYKNQKNVILKCFLLSLLVQLNSIGAVYLLSRGLKISLPLLPLFMFIPIISTLATLPVSISGIGVREASFVLLLGFLGIPPAYATAISLAWFLSVVIGSSPGLIAYVRYGKSKAPILPKQN